MTSILPKLALGLALLVRPAAQAPSLPFEKAGREVVVQADLRVRKEATPSSDVRRRLSALHERVRLGAFELWLPHRALNEKLAAKDGPAAKEFAQLAQDLVRLQEPWIDRVASPPTELANAHDAIDVLARWVGTVRGDHFPEAGEELRAAQETLERHFFRRVLDAQSFAVVIVVAPTRAQYLGLLGAAEQVDSKLRGTLALEAHRRTSSAQLVPGLMVLAQTGIGEGERAHPLKDRALDPVELRQNNAHAAAHMLGVAFTPAAPGWWGEGLAICDTIAACGADETVCTGHADLHSTAGIPVSGSLLDILLWVSRHKSPYRGESASWFRAPLREAAGPEGVKVLDLDRSEVAGRAEPPLLSDRAALPPVVVAGTPGTKKGYAELYRAWCTGFVHWLSSQPGREDSLLVELSRELGRHAWEPGQTSSPLYELCPRITRRTLGASSDPETDLEAAFAASLLR